MFLIPKNGKKTSNVWALNMPWIEPIFNEVGMVIFLICYVCSKIENKNKVWWLNEIPLINMQGKGKLLMVNGLWVQNVGMQKMKLLMLNYQQQLSFNSLILVK
jgi:hypothetical protein